MSLAVATPNGDAGRRKSGRTMRRPDVFSEEVHEGSILSNGSAKRKRTPDDNIDPEDEEDEASSSSSDGGEDDEEPDEEELKEKRKAAKARNATKPVQKKAKTTKSITKPLAIRPASAQNIRNARAAPQKIQKARARQSQANQDTLYATVFGKGNTGEAAAVAWLDDYERDNIIGMRNLVNFILECAGSNVEVEPADIEDVDNVASKLGDLQELAQGANISDYPLVSRAKQFVGFQEVLEDFFISLIKTMAAKNVLFEDTALFDNIHTWVDTMSDVQMRPFRHTATAVALSITTALAELARDEDKIIADATRQLETENKKKTVNKGRVKSMQQELGGHTQKLAILEELLKDEFDLVYVHRYRDVDPRIRVDCAAALGKWIQVYRKMFLEGQYLRYLGWVLSDTNAATRTEVLRQLKALYKGPGNLTALRGFTDRFRPRIVEIATQDVEPGVRSDAIELLDRLREVQYLEPDDADSIGRLIFDTEPRVRKAVAKFFVSNIEDLYAANTDEFDKDDFSTALPDHTEDYMLPCKSWIRFKCLAETLTIVDLAQTQNRTGARSKNLLVARGLESRYMLATQAIYPYMRELQDWENLAGYLLYDHSSIDASSEDSDVPMAVQGVYKLQEGQEAALLEVLDYAVKLYLQETIQAEAEKKGKRTKLAKDDVQSKQELAAHNLAEIIPKLLSLYGTLPQAASAILRLEQLLDMDLVNTLSRNEAAHTSLLEDINKQFMEHSDQGVLVEASMALNHARQFDQSKEDAELKISEIWDDSLRTLQNLLKDQVPSQRGNLPNTIFIELSNTISRLAQLAKISDCSSILESRLPAQGGRKQKASSTTALQLLFELNKRAVYDDTTTPEFNQLEDELSLSVMSILLFYFMWKVAFIRSAVTAKDYKSLSSEFFKALAAHQQIMTNNAAHIVASRKELDHVRINTLSTVLDVYLALVNPRDLTTTKPTKLSDSLRNHLEIITKEVPVSIQDASLQTHTRLERSFASKINRKLDQQDKAEPAENDAPIDSDDEEDDVEEEIDEGDEEMSSKDLKRKAALLAEQSLCDLTAKIVTAVIAGIFDNKVKTLLLRNRFKLGPNYKELVGYLDDKKDKKAMAASKKAGVKPTKASKSAEIVLEDPNDPVEDDDNIQEDDDPAALQKQGLLDEELDEPEENEENEEPIDEEDDNMLGD